MDLFIFYYLFFLTATYCVDFNWFVSVCVCVSGGCWFERTAYFVRPYTCNIDTSSKKIITACCFVRKLIENVHGTFIFLFLNEMNEN